MRVKQEKRKKERKKGWEWDVHKGFEKFQHIPENHEGYMHSCAHTQERPEIVPKLSRLVDFKVLHKQEGKAKAEL